MWVDDDKGPGARRQDRSWPTFFSNWQRRSEQVSRARDKYPSSGKREREGERNASQKRIRQGAIRCHDDVELLPGINKMKDGAWVC